VASARARRPVIRGPDDAVGTVEVRIDVPVAVDVVAGRDHVDAGVEDLASGLLGDPEPPGGVLAVGDHQVGVEALAQLGHREGEAVAARPAADVADEEDYHRASVKRRYRSRP
jgi:hypothetical protein